jgi:hypothetical protein
MCALQRITLNLEDALNLALAYMAEVGQRASAAP